MEKSQQTCCSCCLCYQTLLCFVMLPNSTFHQILFWLSCCPAWSQIRLLVTSYIYASIEYNMPLLIAGGHCSTKLYCKLR